MRNPIQKRKSEGFTIIEVMIVLAIAGLILLIVFLAVPALQRNAHNTSIKNDVSGLLGGVNEYTNNNNGVVPTTVSNGTANSVDIGAAGSNVATVKLGYIDASTASNVTLGKLASGTKSAPAVGVINIWTNAACDSTAAGQAKVGSGSRSVVALFTLEGGAKECQES